MSEIANEGRPSKTWKSRRRDGVAERFRVEEYGRFLVAEGQVGREGAPSDLFVEVELTAKLQTNHSFHNRGNGDDEEDALTINIFRQICVHSAVDLFLEYQYEAMVDDGAVEIARTASLRDDFREMADEIDKCIKAAEAELRARGEAA